MRFTCSLSVHFRPRKNHQHHTEPWFFSLYFISNKFLIITVIWCIKFAYIFQFQTFCKFVFSVFVLLSFSAGTKKKRYKIYSILISHLLHIYRYITICQICFVLHISSGWSKWKKRVYFKALRSVHFGMVENIKIMKINGETHFK